MKILSIEKIREADAFTIKNEPIADIDLMERAAGKLCDWISEHIQPNKTFRIFSGLGNNGGDGFALGRLLIEKGYKVYIHTILYSGKMSPSCFLNYERVKQTNPDIITELKPESKLPEADKSEVIVDAIFGSGLTRPVTGFIGDVVDYINSSASYVIAIDAPSGFFCDESNSENPGSIVRANVTLTFQFPKFGFVFPENYQYTGDWEVLPIGLHPEYIKECKVKKIYIEGDLPASIIRKRKKIDHKGTFGHGLLIAGSSGKMGAAILGAKASLRCGAGLISTHLPRKGYSIMQTAVPEAMVSIDADKYAFTQVPELNIYNAIAIGPGLGMSESSQRALKLLIQNTHIPLILDADAINILAENKTWISFLPKQCILTPHPKEFERLVGKSSDQFERNRLQIEFSVKYNVYVILKGANTAISWPEGTCWFNSTGNPGMATAGSGDVLTGILLGLKAQG
ncbi:MAG: NAD(P)H-hydrate dehydratase, partial [Bacteroidales bacterium]|nr:NAD(P)H-hydrate dehydratase [Bacteroidales bacterium]